jgi:ribosome modulation factor
MTKRRIRARVIEREQQMPRPKGSKNKPKTNGADERRDEPQAEVSRGIGDNGVAAAADLGDDDLQVLFFQGKRDYKAALEAKKAADAALKNICKRVRADLGKRAVDDIKTAILLESPEGEAELKARIDSEMRVARWMGMPVGAQGSMFDEVDRTPAADRAFGEGKRAGFEGARRDPPYDPSTEQHQHWLAGHSEGQAALVRANLRPLSDTEELSTEGPDEPLTEEIAHRTFGTEPATADAE